MYIWFPYKTSDILCSHRCSTKNRQTREHSLVHPNARIQPLPTMYAAQARFSSQESGIYIEKPEKTRGWIHRVLHVVCGCLTRIVKPSGSLPSTVMVGPGRAIAHLPCPTIVPSTHRRLRRRSCPIHRTKNPFTKRCEATRQGNLCFWRHAGYSVARSDAAQVP